MIGKVYAKLAENNCVDGREEETKALQELATKLHEKYCHWNHIDGCGWDYEESATYRKNLWNEWAHKHWLEEAKEILTMVIDSRLV